jgi:aryl-alcohol dehydrogenase-like predicted oxidoreductase
MQQRTIDQTDLNVSRIALGTGSLHHLRSSASRQTLLYTAFDAGITHFDTSPYYGYGLAEKALGRFLRGRRAAVTVTSKIGLYAPGWTPCGRAGVLARKAMGRVSSRFSAARVDWTIEAAAKSLERTLKRLGTDHLDLLLLHEPSPECVPAEVFLPWLEDQKQRGRIRWWGLAGPAGDYATWVQQHHPLSQVIQTHDTLAGGHGDVIQASGRALQFTYGYLRHAGADGAAVDTLKRALQRNETGCVVVSTRRAERIAELAGAAQ